MIFWRYTTLFFSAIALLSLQKMPCLSPKSLSQNAELILCPLLNPKTIEKTKPLFTPRHYHFRLHAQGAGAFYASC